VHVGLFQERVIRRGVILRRSGSRLNIEEQAADTRQRTPNGDNRTGLLSRPVILIDDLKERVEVDARSPKPSLCRQIVILQHVGG
jgi:hypothetical protein